MMSLRPLPLEQRRKCTKSRGWTGQMYALKAPGQRQDVLDSVIAAQHAKDFGPGIRFVVPVLAQVNSALDDEGNHVEGWENREVLLEPLLQGVYEKFVCRRHKYGGGTFTYHPIPQAFFHFTYESSGSTSVVWDLQGVKEENGDYLLTDPFIVHDHNMIWWRYGSQHSTFRILHTKCNDRCPHHAVDGRMGRVEASGHQQVSVYQKSGFAEQGSGHQQASTLLDWHPPSLCHTCNVEALASEVEARSSIQSVRSCDNSLACFPECIEAA